MSVIWFSQKNKETITYVVILTEPTSLMYFCPYFLSCCLPQWPHFEQATLEWISYREFTDMLLNWKDAIGWLVPALSSSCRVWQPLRLQITLHCASQVAPGFLQLHLDVKLWAPQSDTGIYQELVYLTGGWWYAFDYPNSKIVDVWSHLLILQYNSLLWRLK